jgi:hypothetical protein
MLEVDAKKRISAHDLVRDPYIACTDIRLTAFETSGTTFRQVQSDHYKKYGRSNMPLNLTSFQRENIKDAHITAINHLVSQQQN